jgi:hypothetical protein
VLKPNSNEGRKLLLLPLLVVVLFSLASVAAAASAAVGLSDVSLKPSGSQSGSST